MKSTSPPPALDRRASSRTLKLTESPTDAFRKAPSDYVISGKRRSHYEKAIAAARTVGTR